MGKPKPGAPPGPMTGSSVAAPPPPGEIRVAFRTHISIDKPIYKPGDLIRFRGEVISPYTQQALFNSQTGGDDPWPKLKILSPKGDAVFEGRLEAPEMGTIGGEWLIPENMAGGDYKLVIVWPYDTGFVPATREFNVRAHSAKRLKTQLEFEKRGYSPGDTAVANLTVERSEGGIPAGAPVEAIARVDGDEAWRGQLTVGDDGKVVVSFPLPQEGSEGTLSCVITDGGVVETASKTIPILLNAIDIHVYPEGGNLVAGLRCGLYIEAYTPVGDPADILAQIEDVETGEVAGTIETEHEGRGRASFVVADGRSYQLRTTRPSGIVKPNILPTPVKSGVSIRAKEAAYAPGVPLTFTLSASDAGEYDVVVCKVDTEIGRVGVALGREEVDVAVPLAPLKLARAPRIKRPPPAAPAAGGSIFDRIKFWETKEPAEEEEEEKEEEEEEVETKPAEGVLRVTVYKAGTHIAERLIFVMPTSHINVAIDTDKPTYAPGDRVMIKLKATDGDGAPVHARLGVTVADDAVLEMVETRKQMPRLPAVR